MGALTSNRGGASALRASTSVIAFVATSPYVLLDFAKFSEDFAFLFAHMEGGHFGQEIPQSGFRVYLEMLLHPWGGWVLCGGMALGLVAMLSGRPQRSASLLLLAFPPLEAAGVLQLMDRVAGTSFFMPSGLVVSGEVLAVSGGGRTGLVDYLTIAEKLGVDRTLHKPILPQDLIQVVRELLSDPGSASNLD